MTVRQRALTVVALGAVVLAGCVAVTTESSSTVSETMDLPAFSRLDVSSAFTVDVQTGETPGVTVTTDANLRDALEVGVTDGTLRIGLRPGTTVRNATLQAEVAATQLDAVTASGATRVWVDGELTGERVTLELSGASELTAGIVADVLVAGLSGASTGELEGSAGETTLQLSGASEAYLDGLDVARLDADLSGSSSASVQVSDTLAVSLSGASELRYDGEPTIERQQVTGSSVLSGG